MRLVGVSENPSRGKAWWTPDGASGQAAPYASCQNEDHVTTMKVQELAVRLAGLPNAATDFAVLADGSGSCNLSRPVSATGHPADPSLQAVVAEYPKSAATGGLYFGVADGPWQTAASRKFRPDGLDGGQSWTSGAAVVISASKSVDRPLIVSVAHDVQGMDTRIVAVDRRGRTLTPELLDRGGTSTNGFSGTLTLDQALQDYHNVSQSLVTFPGLPLKDIREVRFQTRPYQWVRFQGIALQSNQAPRAPVRKGV